jgi:hypothetical protein
MQRSGMRGIVWLLAVAPAGLLLGCGGGGLTTSATAHPAATVVPTPTPTPTPPPSGGPAPPELAGTWTEVVPADVHKATVYLDGTDYRVNGAEGSIAVNGTEIDFFDGPCDGLGRYQWSIKAGVLHFTSLASDPCGRVADLDGRSYTRNAA